MTLRYQDVVNHYVREGVPFGSACVMAREDLGMPPVKLVRLKTLAEILAERPEPDRRAQEAGRRAHVGYAPWRNR